ncbi:aminomethyltransferase [Methylosinus sp. C49]|uniref:glycine cleavage system aminomethyltransferase GcvT n=1 Tax=Methylosinus sp. C49 TaxID=2699395 RepID=UPI00136791CD|nr:glycine cleavage system aminomethyltransferase GcvT [Methylosinus sp. C49]BBU61213.1 aminomethyltransferase [Methylosinus sp. C49]
MSESFAPRIPTPLEKTPLDALHRALGARMTPFAGYELPLHYPAGVVAEHIHTREKASLFDVSHMGQAILGGRGAAEQIESLVPAAIADLHTERTRYSQLLAEDGGVLDDLMITRLPGRDERLLLIVNAAAKQQDFALLRQQLPQLALSVLTGRALIALQGPRAAAALATVLQELEDMPFMGWRAAEFRGAGLFVSRSGYTGEDGFEISVPNHLAEPLAEALLGHPDVAPAGLAARDSLRLEAGLCLYGHDLDATTDPIEAGLAWSIGKRRREQGGFPGYERIRAALAHGPARLRVGLLPEGRAPLREGAALAAPDGRIIGRITSGGYSPTLSRPIAMGYVESGFATPGVTLESRLRDKPVAVEVTSLPFVPHRFFRGPAGKDRS